MEKRILGALLKSRGNYESIKDLLGDGISSTFSPIAQVVAKLLEDFYSRDRSATTCPKEVLLERVSEKGHNFKAAKEIGIFLSDIDTTVSVPNLMHDIRLAKRHRIGDKLVGYLANRDQGPEVEDLLAQYKALGEPDDPDVDESDVYSKIPTRDLLDRHFSPEGTIPFGNAKLNRACNGGARAGHHVLVFARPEVGKTLFTLDLVASPLESGHCVLYIGNEDPLSDILLRISGRIARKTTEEIRRDPDGTHRVLIGRGYENFIGVSASPGSFGQIDKLCKKYSPSIVVLDQLRNIDVGDDNRVTALEKAAIGGRNLAKSNGVVVISLTQAGDSAEGRQFLDLSDIDFSKTGIPGQIDLAIGIGATQEGKRTGVRGISLPKNKLSGKHETFLVRFNTNLGLVEEVS